MNMTVDMMIGMLGVRVDTMSQKGDVFAVNGISREIAFLERIQKKAEKKKDKKVE